MAYLAVLVLHVCLKYVFSDALLMFLNHVKIFKISLASLIVWILSSFGQQQQGLA
jgi:hypothetical protein